MFHRRHRSTSATRQSNVPPPASSSAQSAATLAFLAHRQSQSNLSASAAAAALRAMSPPATPVGQLQTKRMLNRQSSVSSNGSSHGSRPKGLQRTNSTGSMTERTFRGPSPNRSSSSAAKDRPPPVPAVPRTYVDRSQQPRRPASVEPPPPRVISPPPKKPLGRGMSVDRGAAAGPKKTVPKRVELERSDSRNSINFSYPMSARPNSPPAIIPAPSKPAVQNASASKPQQKPLSSAEADQIQYSLAKTAAQPVKKKKKKVVRGAAEGSHLASGGMGARPMVTPLEPGPIMEEEPSMPDNEPVERPAKKKKKKVAPSGEASHFGDRPQSPNQVSDNDSATDKENERRAQRAAGLLAKQPSVVREDWEGEQGQGDQGQSPTQGPPSIVQGKKPLTAANVSKKLDEDKPTQGYLQVSGSGSPGQRTTSLSPSRSTRFALLSSDMSGQAKHEPPARSVSPAKSALKHHSLGTSLMEHHMPGGWRRSSQTPSEASDNTSMASADIPTPIQKKKKSVRVSFDAEPKIAPSSPETENFDSLASANNQQKDSGKKSWFGSKSKGPALGTIPADDEMEEVMKPRPALPSFGSVRTKGRESPEEITAAYSRMTSPSSSEASSVSNIPTVDTSVSSDHASGGVLAQDYDKLSSRGQKARFAEGTDTLDTDGSVFNAESKKKNASGSSKPKMVPVIAVLPATPGLESSDAPDQWLVRLPGEFPDGLEMKQRAVGGTPTSAPAGLGIAEPMPQVASSPSLTSEALRQQNQEESSEEEEDDDGSSAGDSIYSDAAEDIGSLDASGFGSINAIVESPIVNATEAWGASPPESPTNRPLAKSASTRPNTGPREGSWDEAQAHWSGVADRYRKGVIQPGQEPPISPQHTAPRSELGQPQKQVTHPKKAPPPSSFRSDSPARDSGQESQSRPVSQSSAYPPIGVARAPSRGHGSMRQSMRSQPAQPAQPAQLEVQTGSHFRQSMRTPAAQPSATQTAGNTGRTTPLKSSLKKNQMPPPSAAVTAAASLATTKGARQTSSASSAQPQSKPTEAMKPLTRTLSNGSESDSSFRKQRRSNKSSDGRYNMRRSLRSGGSIDELPGRTQSTRRDVRSLSPANRRQPSPGPPATMRSTMRSNDESNVPSLRGQGNHQRASSAMSGTGKPKINGRSPSSASKQSKPMTSKLKSRFVQDSDDEKTPVPKVFRSRFEDSSDDEPEPVKLRPVRGIPRKANDGDSTDLDDSSEDQVPSEKPRKGSSSSKQPPKIVTESNGNVVNGKDDRKTSSAADSPASPTAEKKRSFLGRLLGKKSKAEDSTTVPPVPPLPAAVGSPAEGNHVTSMESESDVPNGTAEAPPTIMQKGKLQRRSMPERVMSDSWPLPPKIGPTIPEEERPNTSAGVTNPAAATIPGTDIRPGMAQRNDTPTSFVRGDAGAVLGKSGKKKRFPKLRKAFGLTD